MKRMIIIILGVFLLGYSYIYFTSSHSTCYNSVSSYIKDNPDYYYDFYLPESYLDNNAEKQTLKDLNKIKVYYNINPQENYTITYKIDNLEFIYRMNKTDVTKEDVANYQIINNKYNIYYDETSNFLTAIYFYNDGVSLELNVNSKNDITYLKNTVIQILIDSIDLNL